MAKAAYIITLDEATERTPFQLVGSETAGLVRLAKLDFASPGGFVITSEALNETINRSGEWNAIHAAIADAVSCSDESRAEKLNALKRLFITMPIPVVIEAQIRQAYEAVAGEDKHRVAARVSPSLDGPAPASLHPSTAADPDELIEAVRIGWAEAFEALAVAGGRSDLERNKGVAAILVHEYPMPVASGSATTCDPATGDRMRIVIHSHRGDSVIYGGADTSPESIKVARNSFSVLERNCGPKGPSGLAEEQARELAKIAAKIEDRFGAPQELDWLLHEGKLLITASRALPAESLKNDVTVWTRLAFVEMPPEPPTPAAMSCVKRYAKKAHTLLTKGKAAPQESDMIREINGRPYFNLTLAAEMIGESRFLDARTIEAFHGTPFELTLRPSAATGFAATLSLRFALDKLVVESGKYLKGAPEAINSCRGSEDRFLKLDLKSRADAALYLVIEDLFGDDLDRLLRVYIEGARLSRILLGAITVVLRTKLGEAAHTSALGLLAGNGSAEGLAPSREIWEIGRLCGQSELAELIRSRKQYGDFRSVLSRSAGGEIFMKGLEKFLKGHGKRTAREAELSAPRWNEDPGSVYAMILASADSGAEADPVSRTDAVKAAFAKNLAEAKKNTPILLRSALDDCVSMAHKIGAAVESFSALLSENFFMLRTATLEAGRRFADRGVINAKEDIFYLSLEETLRLLALDRPAHDPKETVARRRAKHEYDKTLDNPAFIMGDTPPEDLDGSLMDETDEDYLPGRPVSLGKITGRAKIIRHPDETSIVKSGEILVAERIDPNLPHIYPGAAGFVVEEGGIFSSFAIMARAIGAPAIAGTPNACSLIEDGAEIVVDADAGRVWLRPPPPEPEPTPVVPDEPAQTSEQADEVQKPADGDEWEE